MSRECKSIAKSLHRIVHPHVLIFWLFFIAVRIIRAEKNVPKYNPLDPAHYSQILVPQELVECESKPHPLCSGL